MWRDIINTAMGLAVGLITGFFFERRATRVARDQNRQLEKELESVRHSVYSMGGPATAEEAPIHAPSPNLQTLVRRKANSLQDVGGRVARTHLATSLLEVGHHPDDIENAITELIGKNELRQEGKWLILL
jgi:uncharacterized protein YneF (UPF0154 family)